MMRGYFGTFGGFGWIELVFVVIMTAVFVGVVVLILYFIRSMRRRPNQDVSRGPAIPPQVLTPKDIIQARYARGEITREQYLAILEDLK